MKNIDARIATLILRAQNASDGGKHKHILICNERSYRDNCAGYGNKDVLVYEALNLIVRNRKNCNFKFSVTYGGVTPYLVYFETRINCEKFQVSFHSKDRRLRKFMSNSFRMKWDALDSRESAVRIYEHYVPNGEYGGGYYG